MEQHVLAFERYAARNIPIPVAKLSRKSRLQRVRWANRLLSAVFQTDLGIHTQHIAPLKVYAQPLLAVNKMCCVTVYHGTAVFKLLHLSI